MFFEGTTVMSPLEVLSESTGCRQRVEVRSVISRGVFAQCALWHMLHTFPTLILYLFKGSIGYIQLFATLLDLENFKSVQALPVPLIRYW